MHAPRQVPILQAAPVGQGLHVAGRARWRECQLQGLPGANSASGAGSRGLHVAGLPYSSEGGTPPI